MALKYLLYRHAFIFLINKGGHEIFTSWTCLVFIWNFWAWQYKCGHENFSLSKLLYFFSKVVNVRWKCAAIYRMLMLKFFLNEVLSCLLSCPFYCALGFQRPPRVHNARTVHTAHLYLINKGKFPFNCRFSPVFPPPPPHMKMVLFLEKLHQKKYRESLKNIFHS